MKLRNLFLILAILAFGSLVLAQNAETEGNQFASDGDKLFAEGKFEEAGVKFDLALQKYREAKKADLPVDEKIAKMIQNSIVAYYKAKNYDKLLVALEQKKNMNPNDFETVKNIAVIQKSKKSNIDAAIQVLLQYNQNYENVEARTFLATYYSEKEDYKNALIWFTKAFDMKADPEVLKSIAVQYLKLKDATNAIKTYEDYLKTNPEDKILVTVYKNLGAMYDTDMNNPEKATEYFIKSLNIEFKKDIALKCMQIFYDGKKFDQVITMADRILSKEPGETKAYYYKALVKYERKDLAGAKAEFEKCVSDNEIGSTAKQYIESIKSQL